MTGASCARCAGGKTLDVCTCPEYCGELHCRLRSQAGRDFLSARSRRRAATVRKMAGDGHSVAWICRATGLSDRTVYRYLKENPA